MAKERSNNSRYPSRYSPNIDKDGFAWVTGRQYIVELICENKALQDKYQYVSFVYQFSLTVCHVFVAASVSNFHCHVTNRNKFNMP